MSGRGPEDARGGVERSAAVGALALFATLGLSGCVNQMTGDVMSAYSADHLIPYLLEAGDTGMACETGVSLGSFLASFGRVTDEPHRTAIPTLLSAGVCAQEMAFEADLRSRRAFFRGIATEAKDARIEEQRHNVAAARRFFEAWQRTVAGYGEPGGKCPEFDERFDELAYLLGLVSVLQALQHDLAADGSVGVPLDAPRKAARATECLNNARWWGVPNAIRAVVWTSIPGSAPEGADPWYELSQASTLGRQAGVRLAEAIEAQAAWGAGRRDVLEAVIRSHAKSLAETPSAAKWKTVDRIATLQIQALSDRIWTEAQGHRTPFGRLGTLPGDSAAPAGDPEGEGDLLDGLVDESGPASDVDSPPPQEN